MKTLNTLEVKKYLQNLLICIHSDYDDDEAASEHYAEISSIIHIIENRGTDEEILKAANNVSISLSSFEI